jgi:S-adenosylmethionine:tRNA ribosyltransferase-isomerase
MFSLPESQVAQYPAQARSDSQLMVLKRSGGTLQEDVFRNIEDYIPTPSVLVLNTSRVFPARLIGSKEDTHGQVEFLLLTPPPLIQAEHEHCEVKTAKVKGLIKPSGKVKPGQVIRCAQNILLQIEEKYNYGQVQARLEWTGDLLELLALYGQVPLPPYIKRPATNDDQKRYQTVYAKSTKSGSVAAPTAGLHFTTEILEHLQTKGVVIAPITLHVGYGTFSPVRESDIRNHVMHSEFVDISQEAASKIEKARSRGHPVIAVGTTTVRALETVMKRYGHICAYQDWTDLYIFPGFQFQAVDHLITNFHLPGSSLLLMVSAFVGREILLSAYEQAVQKKYRFFSYGDVMLLL